MSAAAVVFATLADGARHDAEALARRTGLDVRQLDAAVEALVEAGVAVDRSDEQFGLATTIDWIDAAALRRLLAGNVAAACDVDVRVEARSSNDELLARKPPAPGHMPVCIVEFQHGGRGRRGRSWVAPPGGALCLSAGWYFPGTPAQLSALSLVVGVSAIRALAAATGVRAGVKWPNDLVFDERKLGGILVEVRNDSHGTHVVAGIGINFRIPPDRLAAISDWPRGAVDLASAGSRSLSRTAVAAALVDSLWQSFRTFERAGFEPFVAEWHAAHVLTDRPAVLRHGDRVDEGVVRGIDADGALRFEQDGSLRRVLVGDVSLRAAS